MNEIIYLEPSEEITSVIDRLRATVAKSVAFVIPRGATIAQSIVNLKLLRKSAGEMQKEISLVSTDRISRNLASQIGLTVYSKVSEAERAQPVVVPKVKITPDEEAVDPNASFKVNNYYKEKSKEEDEEDLEIKNELKQMAKEDTAMAKKEDDEAPAESIEKKKEEEGEPAVHFEDHRGKPDEEQAEDIKIEKRPLNPEKNMHDHSHDSIPPRKEASMKQPNSKPDFNHKTNVKGSRKILIIFGSVFAVVLLVAAYLMLPTANVKIQVKTEDFSAEKDITIDKAATANDAAKLTVKGKLLESEKEITKTFDATGTKDVGTKATGTLTFNNYYGVDTQIPAGTSVKSSAGIEFVTDKAITIAGATASVKADGTLQTNPGKMEGSVTAKDSGERSNLVSATVYSVIGKPLVTAAGETTGGVSKVVKVVTESDIKKADAAVQAELAEFAKTDLGELAKTEKLSIFDDAIKSEIISSNSSKNANDESDKFDYTIKLKSSTIGFVKTDLDGVLVGAAEKDMGGGKMVVAPENAEKTYVLTDKDISDGNLKAKASLVGKSGQKLSENDIKKQIKGKTVSSAEKSIEESSSVENASITMKPSFINQVPFLTKSIKVTFGFAK